MSRSGRHLIVGIVIIATLTRALTSPVTQKILWKTLRNDEEFRVTVYGALRYKYQNEAVISCGQLSNNSWSRLLGDNLNLPLVSVVKFSNYLIPEAVNLRKAVVRSLTVGPVDSLYFLNLRSSLSRQNLRGLSIGQLTIAGASEFLELPADTFRDVSDVKSLTIEETGLASISPGLFGNWSKNLRKVSFLQNKLRKIGRHDLAGLDAVEDLLLNGNQISKIELGAFDELSNLRMLDISSNRLRSLPAGLFRRLRSLETLHMNDNCFDELPAGLLADIEDCHLRSFRMNGNEGSLITMPDGFFRNLVNLTSVQLVDNRFASLPNDLFAGTSALEKLDLSTNDLRALPSGLFRSTRKLVELCIMENRIEDLPKGIFQRLNNLERLYLNDNLFTNISSNILEGMDNLRILEAAWNNISNIDLNFCEYVPKLEEIELSGNQLTLEGEFSMSVLAQCVHLMVLRASDNKIPRVYDDWILLPLGLIDLRYNEVTEFGTHQLTHLHHELTIFLQNNKISTVDLRNLENATEEYQYANHFGNKQIKVYLGNNPLNCDCRLKDFFRYFEYKLDENVRGYVEIYADLINEKIKVGFEGFKCTSPKELTGRNITDIRSENLNCAYESNKKK